ncbi:hypothetical protein GCHA_1086 [Paraglaciecola chathamensis S18K6]|uniref:Uncharacterized protein n=1 Tax=Paraglaciecola chathamensis S18K6 TaxID=1127672 RepID=A0AAV3UVW9_9ALTE|nr:hypothetical protein GCHA_1086 [Paraglaciecola chathamensis S18K6]
MTNNKVQLSGPKKGYFLAYLLLFIIDYTVQFISSTKFVAGALTFTLF